MPAPHGTHFAIPYLISRLFPTVLALILTSTILLLLHPTIITLPMGIKSSKMNSDSSDSVDKLISDAIATHPVLIFSKTYCPFCHMAKDAIADAGQSVAGFPGAKVFELDTMGSRGRAIQSALASRTGRHTVPNVFIGGVPVGGGDDVSALHRSGVLKQMLTQAPDRLATLHPVAKPSVAEPPIAEPPVLEPPVADPPSTIPDPAGDNDAPSPPQPERSPADEVEALIADEPVAVFSKSYCPYCMRAKALLSELGEQIDGYTGAGIIELDEIGERGRLMQNYLLEKTGQSTVPNIFIGGQHVGGASELRALHDDEKLLPMLREAFASKGETNDLERTTERVIFGAGCFWGVQLAFQRVTGVVSTEVGYSNGQEEPLSYEQVCSGTTGANEVVAVEYDPKVVGLPELIKVWESRHDVTSVNRQGNDVGTQYRSGVYWENDDQREMVENWKTQTVESGVNVATEIGKVVNYVRAEEYHQRYLEKKGQSAEKGETEQIRCYG